MSLLISKDTAVDQLVQSYPQAVKLLIEQGLPCVVCGEPFWGSIEELARQKGWNSGQIDQLVAKLNTLAGDSV